MAIDEREETFLKFLQDLSAALAAVAAANAEILLPSGADKEMKKLSESIQQIALTLKDTKLKSEKKSNASAAWVRELKETVYEIDSLLHLFSPKADHNDKIPARSINPRTVLEMKAMRSRLDKILKKQNILTANTNVDDDGTMARMSITNCPVEPLTLQGGKKDEDDKERIISLMLSVRDADQSSGGPCIVAIDRKGGVGTTTELARSIFDDKRVLNHFTRRIWVAASDIVDSDKLSKLVSRPASTLFWVHRTVGVDSEEQQVLLVLDDIRNKKSVELRGSWIRDGGRQNERYVINDSWEIKRGVLISTVYRRFYGPADAVKEPKSKRLSAEESWAVFRELAFAGGRRPELETVGRSIVGNLEGSDAMIREVGSILSAKLELKFWKLMLQSQVWRLPVEEVTCQPMLAELCYHPSQPRPRTYFTKRY